VKTSTQCRRDRAWFLAFALLFAFGVAAALATGMSGGKLVFVTIAFALFIHSGITMEIRAHHAEHDQDGHG